MAAPLVYPFDVTIPAGTQKTTPLVTSTKIDPNTVDRITWTFPHGCNGQVGIQIGSRAAAVIPADATKWFTTSGNTNSLDLEDYHETGDWSVIGYNTGNHAHTIQVQFHVRRKEQEYKPPHNWSDFELSNAAPHVGWS